MKFVIEKNIIIYKIILCINILLPLRYKPIKLLIMFYFVLGVLSVLALFLIAVLIYGMVKISKLTTKSKNFEDSINRDFENIHRRIDENKREVDNNFERSLTEINRQFQGLYSYTDSRIDKSLNHKK